MLNDYDLEPFFEQTNVRYKEKFKKNKLRKKIRGILKMSRYFNFSKQFN